ncbi:hypothetical protein [Fodinicola acaciae]|uniref:hypothetical protein n=1 Tax=Fodinicola acaciae TaxID=2681555 RepID=UPI0013D0AFA7|nr:hypothetical protein [Fodinicola acaciae]
MVGVSDPELKADRTNGVRLLGGLTAGYLTATVLIAIPLIGVAALSQQLVDPRITRIAVLLVMLGLGIADLAGRTPYRDRQVPQRFARELGPLPRGLLWGFDLALLVTTQKTASVLWAALLGAVFVGPVTAVPSVLLAAGVVYLGGVSVLSFAGAGRITGLWFGVTLLPWLQRGAGLSLVALAAAGLIMEAFG